MNIVVISSSKVGTKTQTATKKVVELIQAHYPGESLTLIDLKELDIVFSDGRNYLDYSGDTAYVTKTVMDADVLFIGAPTFQGSIPATLKNIFDLLPQNALYHKTVAMIMMAGSPKHFLVAETQLKPILSYMKANIVPNYVFIEDKDFHLQKIVNDDVLLRLETLVENTLVLARTYAEIWRQQEDSYDF
ncbi:NADPH-dependent FMN reductase [Limibacterium fermenti]|uniref:NADPH-dependent FMN reductase n=1 Tax=Limibacterium fermenti TaxID=3229863 RepID=UPI003A70D4AD